MASGIRSDLSLRSPLRGEGWEGRSLVALRAAPASATPFDCCTPLLLGHIRAGRRRHRYAIAGKMLLRLSQDSQSILPYRARLFADDAATGRRRRQSPPSQKPQCPPRGRALHKTTELARIEDRRLVSWTTSVESPRGRPR